MSSIISCLLGLWVRFGLQTCKASLLAFMVRPHSVQVAFLLEDLPKTRMMDESGVYSGQKLATGPHTVTMDHTRSFWTTHGHYGPHTVIFGPHTVILDHTRSLWTTHGHFWTTHGHFGPHTVTILTLVWKFAVSTV